KNALGMMDLANGTVAKIDRVKNFQVPEDGSGFIAYLMEAKPEQKRADEKKPDASAPGSRPTANEGPKTEPPAVAGSPAPGNSPTTRETATAGKPAPSPEGTAAREGANAGRT